jgi:hypothetical protein
LFLQLFNEAAGTPRLQSVLKKMAGYLKCAQLEAKQQYHGLFQGATTFALGE